METRGCWEMMVWQASSAEGPEPQYGWAAILSWPASCKQLTKSFDVYIFELDAIDDLHPSLSCHRRPTCLPLRKKRRTRCSGTPRPRSQLPLTRCVTQGTPSKETLARRETGAVLYGFPARVPFDLVNPTASYDIRVFLWVNLISGVVLGHESQFIVHSLLPFRPIRTVHRLHGALRITASSVTSAVGALARAISEPHGTRPYTRTRVQGFGLPR